MKFSVLLVGLAVTVAMATSASVGKYTDDDIDGKENTIATAVAHQLNGEFPGETVLELLMAILVALRTPEFDYWGEVKDEVIAMVGQYINQHNINQVEVYQEDLQTLMYRYYQAPVETNGTYPNKNQQAAALSTSIIAHRYLIEAAVLPQSMILHFEDISSIHIVVLKDAAETYSFEGYPPSQWWVDLSEELDHYIAYAKYLSTTLREWRIGMLTCDSHSSGKYVIYVASDAVTGEVSECKELEGTTGCENHCKNFFDHKNLEVDKFLSVKMVDVVAAWEQLKVEADDIIGQVSSYYDPKGNK